MEVSKIKTLGVPEVNGNTVKLKIETEAHEGVATMSSSEGDLFNEDLTGKELHYKFFEIPKEGIDNRITIDFVASGLIKEEDKKPDLPEKTPKKGGDKKYQGNYWTNKEKIAIDRMRAEFDTGAKQVHIDFAVCLDHAMKACLHNKPGAEVTPQEVTAFAFELFEFQQETIKNTINGRNED